MRKLLVIILAALVVIGAIVAPITGAFAHSQLESSTPADGARLSEPPTEIVLEFNEPVRKDFGQVQVTGPDEQTYAEGEVAVESSTVTQRLSGLEQEGRYQVGWRVISADGHPVSGSFAFHVGDAGAADTSGGEQADDGIPTTRLVIGGLGALLLIGVVIGGLLATRRRGQGTS